MLIVSGTKKTNMKNKRLIKKYNTWAYIINILFYIIQNSFKNLRKPSSKTLKRRRYNTGDKDNKDIKHITSQNGKKGSPDVHLKSIDASAMFGSVAIVRGMFDPLQLCCLRILLQVYDFFNKYSFL
jgi:hypothetical protein